MPLMTDTLIACEIASPGIGRGEPGAGKIGGLLREEALVIAKMPTSNLVSAVL
ncbi:hypothetical protein [Nocardia pseudobrasiliensis]|uniref:hypothetical protein n=1 Tax=Nocardia pseudobrasiliensis TaxID=45979 RepID=UPI0035A23932